MIRIREDVLRRPTALLAALAAAVVLASCGEGEQAGSARDVAPADTLVYVEATVRPEGDQREQLDALLERFGDQDLVGLAIDGLDSAAAADGLDFTYAGDIEPWLGERASAFFTGFETQVGDETQGAVVFESTDDEAAEAAVRKALEAEGEATEVTDGDHDYYAIADDGAVAVTDGLVITGTEAAVQAAFETLDGGPALVDEDGFSERLDADGLDESFASFYVDVEDTIADGGGLEDRDREVFETFAPNLIETPVTGTLDLGEDGVAIDFSYGSLGDFATLFYTAGTSPLLTELPADAWLATVYPKLGESYRALFDAFGAAGSGLPPGASGGLGLFEGQVERATGVSLDAILGAIGDVGIFVRGDSLAALEGAAVIEVSDQAVAAKLLDAAGRALSRVPGTEIRPLRVGEAKGFAVRSPGVPMEIQVVLDGDRAVIGYGAAATEEALTPTQTLADSDAFVAAEESLGDGTPIGTYVGLGPAIELLAASGGVDAAQMALVAPYLEQLSFLALGSADDGEVGHTRIVAGLD